MSSDATSDAAPGFGPKPELIGAAAAIAYAVWTLIEDARAIPERADVLPSLIGPALEQLAIVLSAATGPLQIASDHGDADPIETARKQYPETLRIAGAFASYRDGVTARKLPYAKMVECIRNGLAELAVSQVVVSVPATRVESHGAEA